MPIHQAGGGVTKLIVKTICEGTPSSLLTGMTQGVKYSYPNRDSKAGTTARESGILTTTSDG